MYITKAYSSAVISHHISRDIRSYETLDHCQTYTKIMYESIRWVKWNEN